jgi:N-methylhydantoinase A/oxoprolinase/acetone carboxylase beta subunit
LADVGDRSAVAHLDRGLVSTALDRISRRVADAVEQMRTTSDPLPVVAVGGGSVLLEHELPGLGTVIRPERFDVANAIGAAIAQVSGEVDRVEAVRDGRRQILADDARQEAIDRAVAAGARPESVQIVEFDEVPIPYLPGNATRIRVKAVGDLALHSGLVSTGQEGSR